MTSFCNQVLEDEDQGSSSEEKYGDAAINSSLIKGSGTMPVEGDRPAGKLKPVVFIPKIGKMFHSHGYCGLSSYWKASSWETTARWRNSAYIGQSHTSYDMCKNCW